MKTNASQMTARTRTSTHRRLAPPGYTRLSREDQDMVAHIIRSILAAPRLPRRRAPVRRVRTGGAR